MSFSLYKVSGIDKSIVTENRLVVAQAWGMEEEMGRLLSGVMKCFGTR